MTRILTFSQKFPSYHPRKGEPTYFVEKLWSAFADLHYVMDGINLTDVEFDFNKYHNGSPKWHTVRNGHRFKAGDYVRPCVWKLKGGRFTKGNNLIPFAPDMEVRKTYDFDIDKDGNYLLNNHKVMLDMLKVIARNDGFENYEDFEHWFPKGIFKGQIISWHDIASYNLFRG